MKRKGRIESQGEQKMKELIKKYYNKWQNCLSKKGNLRNCIGNWILEHRKTSLFLAAGLGVILTNYIRPFVMSCIFSIKNSSVEAAYMHGLFLGLPVFFLLWFFRTHDTQENLNANTFFNALNLLSQPSSKRYGMIQLIYLRNKKKVFKDRIDRSTKGANLQKSDLSGLNLEEFNLSHANLQQVQLQRTNLKGANLQKAILQWSNLQEADLQGVQLQEANLQEADLQYTLLKKSNLQGAQLQDAKLQGVNLQKAQLQYTKLQGANLQKAQLQKAELQEADLTGPYLQKPHLKGADLQGAQLQEADLQSTNLERADVKGADFQGAKYNSQTKFPSGFDPEEHAMINMDKGK